MGEAILTRQEAFSNLVAQMVQELREKDSIDLLSLYSRDDALKDNHYTAEEIETLAQAIAPYGDKVEAISMSFHAFGDEHMPALCTLMRACPNIKSLQMSDNKLTANSLAMLSDTIGQLPDLYSLSLPNNNIGHGKAGEALVRLVEANPHISILEISNNPLTSQDMLGLCHGLEKNNTLYTLHVDDTCIEPEAQGAIHQLLRENRTLSTFTYRNENMDDADKTTFIEIAQQSENKNLDYISPDNGQVGCPTPLRLRRDVAYERFMEQSNARPTPEEQTYAERAHTENFSGMLHWLARIPSYEVMAQHLEAYDAFADTLPLPDMQQGITVGALFTADENGFAPLDNPRLWKDEQAVWNALEKAGERLTPETLHRQTEKGTSLLESALLAGRTSQVLLQLNAQGLQVQAKELLQADGMPNALYNALIEKGDAARLFTADNWRGASNEAMQSAMRYLPENQQEIIPNKHQLRIAVGLAERTQAHGR